MRIRTWVFLLFLCLFFLFLVTQEINLAAVDLGRHLANGREILSGRWEVLYRNFYSFSHPDHPFVNHHWGTGVVFFAIQQLFGFEGLSIFYSLLSLSTFLIFLHLTYRVLARSAAADSALWGACGVGLAVIPLCAARAEIRPEGFSAFFLGVFYWILLNWKWEREGKDGGRAHLLLWVLPGLMVFWVNLHIYFFMGFVILAAFFFDEWLWAQRVFTSRVKTLSRVLAVCGLAAWVNPIGPKLVLFPLMIFRNYGYRVAENQSAFFFLKRTDLQILGLFSFFLVLAGLLFLMVRLLVRDRRMGGAWAETWVTGAFMLLGFSAVRNFSLFGLVALPGFAVFGTANGFFPWVGRKKKGIRFAGLLLAGASFLIFLGQIGWSKWYGFGSGLMARVEGAAEFIRDVPIEGPIFNNYDNGSYLIYYLFPKTRVFVDNRPEAYPNDFFSRLYVPMQENEEVWKGQSEKMAINAIAFYWHDLTPWAQAFLIARVKDPDWVPVYRDPFSIVMVKNVERNQEVVRGYQINRKSFTVRPH